MLGVYTFYRIISTYDCWSISAATVDQLADGVGVIGEVWGEVLVGSRVAVGSDELLEVVGDGGGIVVGHARGCILVAGLGVSTLGEVLERAGERCNGEEAGGNDE